jgi:signal transduction histidine kinase
VIAQPANVGPADPLAPLRAPSTRSAMIRQFLRLYLAMIFPVIVVVLLVSWVAEELITKPIFMDRVRHGASARFDLVRNQLAAVPLEQWKSRIDATRYLYPAGLELDEESEFFRKIHPDPSEMRRFERGEVAFAPAPAEAEGDEEQTRMTYSFQRVPETSLVISIQLFGDPDQLLAYLYFLLIAVIVAAPIPWFWFRPFWRDLEHLSQVTGEIGSGNFSVQAAPVRSATVRPFATAIDQMSLRISELIEAQKSLTNSVAHELTTPIAFFAFSLAILDESDIPEKAKHLVRGMTRGIGELQSLVAELLENARLEHATLYEPESIDLGELLKQSLASAQQGTGSGRVAALEIPVDNTLTRVDCDAHQMHRAVVNLLRNALRYARSRVVLSADQHDGRTSIRVDDDGPGIPAAERVRVYEPFARMDASRTRETGGHGLGLAIVQRVAKLHGGISRIETSPLGGARVSIEW